METTTTVTLTDSEWTNIRIAILDAESAYREEDYHGLADEMRRLYSKVRSLTVTQDLDKRVLF